MTRDAWPCCIVDTRFGWVIVSLVFGYGLTLPWGASAQSTTDTTAFAPYAGALHSRPMVEGLGFEGALTVFDEVRRMHRKLGKPSKRSDLYYRYEGGGFILEVFGRYEAGRFEIARIRYSGDKRRRIRTDTGFRLGDPISQVLDAHGPPRFIRWGHLCLGRPRSHVRGRHYGDYFCDYGAPADSRSTVG